MLHWYYFKKMQSESHNGRNDKMSLPRFHVLQGLCLGHMLKSLLGEPFFHASYMKRMFDCPYLSPSADGRSSDFHDRIYIYILYFLHKGEYIILQKYIQTHKKI